MEDMVRFLANLKPTKISKTHREFRLRNGRGKTCLWKKYILVYFDS
jgi:hypothetical protein